MIRIIFLLFSIIYHPTSFASLNELNEDLKRLSFYGIKSNNEIEYIGVRSVSYLISPKNNQNFFLKSTNETLEIEPTKSTYSLFKFEDNINLFFYVKSIRDNNCLKQREKDKCTLELAPNQIRFLFHRNEDDSRPVCLQYNSLQKKVLLDAEIEKLETAWTIQPAYQFQELTLENIDLDTLIFKIPLKEDISGEILSPLQVKALYKLHHKVDLQVLSENSEFIWASTPELGYIKGLHIMSSHFPLKIHNLKGMYCGIDKDSYENAQKKSFIIENDQEPLLLSKGHRLFLKPYYPINTSTAPLLGRIEIVPGQESLIPFTSASYAFTGFRLRNILNNEELKIYPDFAVHFIDNTLNFIRINNNILTNFGTTVFLTQHATNQTIKSLEASSLKVASALDKSIEKLGSSIEKASKNTGDALIESSKNFSEGMQMSASMLSQTVFFASKSFENSLKMLSLTAQEISEDLKINLRVVSNNLRQTGELLSHSLIETSNNLNKSAVEISTSLKESSSSFSTAFQDLASALEKGTENIAETVEKSSKNFIEGMEKVEKAAKELKNTNHRIEICTIS